MKVKSSKIRIIVSSILGLILSSSLLAGATYALFTSESKVDIVVSSGKVDVKAYVSEIKTFTNNVEQPEGMFGLDGTVKFVENKLQIDGIMPGDKVSFKINVENHSNIAIKYRTLIKPVEDNGLFNGLNVTIDGQKYAGTVITEWQTAQAKAAIEAIEIEIELPSGAGNEFQDKTSTISYTVEAVQGNAPEDATYPPGLTEDDFDSKVAVDNKGVFYDSFKAAMENVADNGAIYLKENSKVDFPTHLNVTKNVAIYGNGADFSGKDISIGTYAAPENTETTVNIYNAKNLVVWGQPVDTRADVWNVNFYNCTNENYNFLMYRGSETGTAKINLTMTNCSASGFHDSIVHTSADGSIVIKNCTFKNNCAPVNIAHKQTGTLTVSVENSKFINCGKVNPADDYFAPARFVNNSETGSLNVTLKNNTFIGTVGTNGDILLGDYRPGKASHKVAAKIETANPVMVKSSEEPAYSYAGGTIVIPVVEAASQEELISAIEDNATGSVKLSENNYTLPSMTNRSIVISGDKNTVIDMTTSGIIGAQNGGLDLTIEGATVNFANDDYKGVTHSKKVTYKDCTITGKQFLYAEEVEFINCKFVQENADYNVWTYGAGKVLFKDCEFSCKGKSVLLYSEGTQSAQTVEFQNCKFNASANAFEKAAIEIDSYGTQYNVIIDQATADNVTGFDKSTVWNVKRNVKPVTVTVAGTVVYN